jgi:peptidoglycan/xylan/chitin deacetylase (PgdA/CDA1 family)
VGLPSSAVIQTLLAVALVTGGAQSHPAGFAQPGDVAQVQALLAVLGQRQNPVTGSIGARTWHELAEVTTRWGGWHTGTWATHLAELVAHRERTPAELSRQATLAVANDLHQLGLYTGPSTAQWSSALEQAWQQFLRHPSTDGHQASFGQDLVALANAAAVRASFIHHWRYPVGSKTSLTWIAWAAGTSVASLRAANHLSTTTTEIAVPTVLRIAAVNPPAAAKPRSAEVPSHRVVSPPPTTPATVTVTGVFANLRPLADLVDLNPSTRVATALIKAETRGHVTITVGVSGMWALTHRNLLRRLARAGNRIVTTGYTGRDVNRLPRWGVHQELSWAHAALASVLGTSPRYLVTRAPLKAQAQSVAAQLDFVPLAASVATTSVSPTTVGRLLLQHTNQIVVEQGAFTEWATLFHWLGDHHFVFETPGQIWASK